MVDEEKFRRVMGHFATGVTVVTSRDRDGVPVGLTVNALTSVSLDPLLLLVCLHREAGPHDPLLESGVFAVNILRRDQGDLAIRFASGDTRERFHGMDVQDAPLGSPLLPEVLGWVECTVHAVHPGGDHSIVVGRVSACEAGEGGPLLFFRGELEGLTP